VITEYPELSTVEVVPLDLQGKHDGCQLEVMSGIVSLMHLELPQSVGHCLLLLHQHIAQPQVGGITVNLKGFSNVRDY